MRRQPLVVADETSVWARVGAMARLDAADLIRSRWPIVCALVYALIAAAFVSVGLRESAVLGFTVMTRVLVSFTQVIDVVLPLLALGGTALVIGRARRDGTFELFFSHPVGRRDYFAAITLVRTVSLVVPLLILMGGLAVTGRFAFGEPVPWGWLGRASAIVVALAWSFTAAGLLISVRVTEPSRAMGYLLAAWIGAVLLVDSAVIGALLRWHWPPAVVFAVAAVNPVETARVALLATAEPTLGTLGPVGWYLFDAVGANVLLIAGVVWPAAAGLLVWLGARRSFERGDLV
jgi:ABC-2 type transport system permease protein